MKPLFAGAHSVVSLITGAFAIGLAVSAEAIVLSPTLFIESASVYSDHATGVNDLAAESVTSNPVFPRGEGWATSTTSNIAPLLAEGAFDILGYDSVAFGASFDTRISFEFAVEPLVPGLSGPVPIDVTMAMGIALDMSNEVTGIADSGNVSAQLGIPGFWTWTIGKSCSAPGGCTGDLLDFTETRTGTVTPDTVYTGEMRVLGHAQGGGLDFYAAASAFVDPTIIISPDFVDADKYRIVFGSGISAVPLPAALPLFLSGLAGLWVFGWRRRQA